jgi:hypothetical protein
VQARARTPPASSLPLSWKVDKVASQLMARTRTLSQSKADTVARQCLWMMSRIATNAGFRCATAPIFAPGSDTPQTTKHTLDSIALVPQWCG